MWIESYYDFAKVCYCPLEFYPNSITARGGNINEKDTNTV